MNNPRPQISRVTRSQAEASASYSRMSRWYHVLFDPFERRYRQAGYRLLAVREGEHTLGVGFGAGEGLHALAEAVGATGSVTGIDIAAGMCQAADDLLTRAGVRARVTLICGDAMKMPFPADTFDAIMMSFTLELFDTAEIPVVLAECRRVLRPGGRICVVAMACANPPGLMQRLYEWAHRRFPTVIDCRPILPGVALTHAGFHVQTSTRMSTFGLPIDIILAKV
jgi:demethylmenaquinone methyltransferase/2-methoxy-6-polyprenyl-1,4-benzoquinol methylase